MHSRMSGARIIGAEKKRKKKNVIHNVLGHRKNAFDIFSSNEIHSSRVQYYLVCENTQNQIKSKGNPTQADFV